MKLDTCPYCARGKLLANFGYLAFKTETSLIIVFKEQSKPGRVIVAYRNDHVAEIKDLSDKERDAFMKDVSDVAKCIEHIYHPDRINYGAFGDELGHLHFHLVPKYRGADEWGGTFSMNPHKYEISDDQCEVIAEKLRDAYDKLIKGGK
jgi:diadenosine tetraphosphate (Ap4A) HIT family hydrolase